MKVKITVPLKSEKWKVSFGATPSYRKDATLIYKLVERRLLRTALKEKTSIEVKVGDDSNESLVSIDRVYLLRTLAIFLEEYLNRDFLNEKYKQYS
jgi:hypothetical protein